MWRDEIAALRSTERLVRLAREARAQVHVLHISTGEEMEFLAGAKDVASCEATPHHLTLSAEDYARLGAKLQMNPPVRGPEHRDLIWRGLQQGVVDVLGSDHAPHTLEEKAKPYPESPSGMTGVQTLVPIMLDHVNAGRLSLERFVDLTSAGPQRLFGVIGKGRIAAGYDADLTVVDMKRSAIDPRFLDRLALTLDALRRQDGDGLAGWSLRTRPPRDVGGRTDRAVDRRGGAVRMTGGGSWQMRSPHRRFARGGGASIAATQKSLARFFDHAEPSLRGAKRRSNPGDRRPEAVAPGLLRCARNDGGTQFDRKAHI